MDFHADRRVAAAAGPARVALVALHWLFIVLSRGRVDGVEACNSYARNYRLNYRLGARPKKVSGVFGLRLNF